MRPGVDGKEERLILLEHKLDEQKMEVEKLSASLEYLRHRLRQRNVQPAVAKKSELGQSAAPVARTDVPEGGGVLALTDSRHEVLRVYYDALELASQGAFDRAAHLFNRFVTDNPYHVYADRAQALLAESYYRNKDYSLAVMASHRLQNRYPYSVKLPDVLLQRAFSFSEMRQNSAARQGWLDILRRYPRSDAALTASQYLSRGRSEEQPKGPGK